ncbi:MAG: NAD(P)/FAD-dependent oxidoreductase [Candidatus Thalassarchaeaceae archaeon]|jgi:digeranylgeranylglycerophospholipid reductase|nr:NAD(P)/FAD-dependent oxidoreductase [Candidatus Thalassarchaeaceae archaeon]
MHDDESWDVIIVGGGPAGSTTARYAASGGLRVLVVDARDPIGSPLQCGELVPSNEEMGRLCPDVPDMDELFRTPESAISRRTERMRLVPPGGRALEFDFEGVVLNRVAHDEALVELAASNGAEFLLGTRVERVDGARVLLKDGRVLNGKVIVGAGGHNDPIRRQLWDEEPLNIPVKFVLMEGSHTDAVELHFGSVAPGGYAWVFPKDGGSNIGLGIQRGMARGKSLNEYAEGFISRYDGEITFRGAGALPISGSIGSFVRGNCLLVGDSAGMVLPSNGAGITIAMIGGRIAGQVIVEHLNEGLDLTEFQSRWNVQMGKVMRNSKRSFRIGSLVFRSPDWLLRLLFNRFTKQFIWRAVTCRPILWLW